VGFESGKMIGRSTLLAISRTIGSVKARGSVDKPMSTVARTCFSTSESPILSPLIQNGVRYPHRILDDLVRWMTEHEYESVQQMRGSMSYRAAPNPGVFERSNYMKMLSSYALRVR